MEEGMRDKLLDDDEIDLEMEKNSYSDRMRPRYSSKVHPTAKISYALSTISTVVQSMELSWHGVYVKPKHKNESGNIFSRIKNFAHQQIGEKKSEIHREHILQNAYGVAQPGEILALMGASGAGKTTLLNYLTQRNIHDVEASGTIRINGEVVKKQLLRKVSAYVQQEDLFIGSMTVLEHLRFMAVLRMGRTHKKNERERRVRMVMADLGLTGAANTVIGVFGKRGLSGGERKRLAFASEIMTSPPLLFCDEPTSGLDSFLAKQVVQVLKTLARRKGMTIVFTIHQPSSQVFEMFDKVLFMAEGRVAFLGDISQATEMWNKLGEPVPEQFNPADHFISSLAMQIGKEKKSLVRINKYCDEFAQSELGKSYMNEAGNGFRRGSFSSSLSSGSEEMLAKAKNSQRYKATWFQQYTALTKRSLISILREPMLLKVRIFQTFIISIILGLVYFQTKITDSTVMNINGFLFQSVANMNFMFQFSSVNLFCDEMPIFMREQLSNLYRVDAYFLAKNTAESVQYIVYPTIFASIVYWMVGLAPNIYAFLTYLLTMIVIINVAVSIGYATACIFGKASLALAILPIFVVPLLAFGGFYINVSSLPPYFYPLKYLSYFAYGFETVAINEWSRVDQIEGCLTTTNTTQCYRTGEDVLHSLSFDENNLYWNLLWLFVMIVVVRIIAFLALLTHANLKK